MVRKPFGDTQSVAERAEENAKAVKAFNVNQYDIAMQKISLVEKASIEVLFCLDQLIKQPFTDVHTYTDSAF